MKEPVAVFTFLPGQPDIWKMFTTSRRSARTIRVLNGDGFLSIPEGSYAYTFEDAKKALTARWRNEREGFQIKLRRAERILELIENAKEEDVPAVDPRKFK